MTHMRYWAATFATALAGGFIALTKFAFTPNHAIWAGFGVAIAAGVASLAGAVLALGRGNQRLSGLSALSALLAGFVVIATRSFTGSTALWLEFAGGLALLLVSLRTLATHEAEVERAVLPLKVNGNGGAVHKGPKSAAEALQLVRAELQLPPQMRSWIQWIANTTLGIAGGFVALTTFAWQNPTPGVDPHWVWAGAGIAAASVALLALGEHILTVANKGVNALRATAIAMTSAAVLVSGALVVTMGIHAHMQYRWVAFALGTAMVGVSIVASAVHELSTEPRVRQELRVLEGTEAEEEVPEAA
jgi:hypothetical protein